jgi:hypothetical protein
MVLPLAVIAAWTLVVSLVVALCVAARDGDRRKRPAAERSDHGLGDQLLESRSRRATSVRSTRTTASDTISSPEHSTRSARDNASSGALAPVRTLSRRRSARAARS